MSQHECGHHESQMCACRITSTSVDLAALMPTPGQAQGRDHALRLLRAARGEVPTPQGATRAQVQALREAISSAPRPPQ